MGIGRRIIRPRAFILLAILALALGGCAYDKQAQGGKTGPEAQAVQEERQGYGNGERTGVYTVTPGTDRSEERSRAASGPDTGTSESKLQEYGHNAEIEDTRSISLLASRGTNGRDYRGGIDAGIFKITAYTAGYESTGKNPGDKGYGETYSGAMVKEWHTIAADLSVLPLGTKVVIEGIDAVFTVEDKGGAVKGKHIDLYMPQLPDAEAWGVQYRKITILEMGDKQQ